MSRRKSSAGPEIDPDFNTNASDRKRRLEWRANERQSRLDAYDREREYAETDIYFAEKAHADAAAAVDEFEKAGKPGRATVARLELGRAEERIDRKRAQIAMIDAERKRWAKKRPDRDADWVDVGH
jgi:hypothetical protein